MLAARQRQHEWMDADDADPAELRQSLSFIEKVNRRLRYTRASISHLDRLTSNWPAERPISILDIATGSADVPREICAWADRRKLQVSIVGIDRHVQTLDVARQSTNDPRVTLLLADALNLPFEAGSFDVVISSMFLHHLDELEVEAVVKAADRIARHAVILADLRRSRTALFWITCFTAFSNPMVKHDARASVRQAFRTNEIIQIARCAGAAYLKCHNHFGHRFVLSGLKPGPASTH